MARFEMMDNSGGDWLEGQQVQPRSRWPVILGGMAVVVVLLAALGLIAWQAGWLSGLGLSSNPPTPEVTELNPAVSSNETVSRQYQWEFAGDSFRLTLQIPKDIYGYYTSMKRAPIEDYSIYVSHPGDDARLVSPLASELKRLAVQKAYDSEETVNFVASFVQNLEYRWEDKEYPNYPVETLVDKGGDCEDAAILVASLLQAMAYDVVLIRFDPKGEDDAGHMAVGVALSGISDGYSYTYDGKAYYYLETTSTPWKLGELPDPKYKTADAIYALKPVPALRFTDFTWGLSKRLFGSDTAYLEVTVTNWGTANANGFHVRAFFDGYESDAKISADYNLAYGYQISGVSTRGITVPSGGGTLFVELWMDGEIVDDWSVGIS
ncbi:MAG: hypothetical protein QUS33_07620 [Dehalococcoidia bacterium]|nr:hypothetical protein [Dehalococcoidia bacterium]